MALAGNLPGRASLVVGGTVYTFLAGSLTIRHALRGGLYDVFASAGVTETAQEVLDGPLIVEGEALRPSNSGSLPMAEIQRLILAGATTYFRPEADETSWQFEVFVDYETEAFTPTIIDRGTGAVGRRYALISKTHYGPSDAIIQNIEKALLVAPFS